MLGVVTPFGKKSVYSKLWHDGGRVRVGAFAHVIASARLRDHLPERARPEFDREFAVVLRRALAQI